MREKLEIWPALPIVLGTLARCDEWQAKWGLFNVAVALEQNNRICQIGLWGSQMDEILAAMHMSFPVLTRLELFSGGKPVPVDPDLFLGGSAPSLRFLHLTNIPFPGLPHLLFSATHLTDLLLDNISHSGYISPEAMVSCFPALTRLERIILQFKSPKSFPIREHHPPPAPTRTLLPSLTSFGFNGVSEYLEDLVARIDTPLLHKLKIYLFRHLSPESAQLAQFINRSPILEAHNEARVVFKDSSVHLKLGQVFEKGLDIAYSHKAEEIWQVSSVAQFCTLSFSQPLAASIERLYIYDSFTYWQAYVRVENDQWLELLRHFTSVKSLYLSQVVVPCIAPALEGLIEVEERVAGVLPALQNLFLEKLNLSGPAQNAIESFVSGREFSSQPVAVSRWEGRNYYYT